MRIDTVVYGGISYNWEQVAQFMDDDIREQLHQELSPCSEEEFLEGYLELVPEFAENFQKGAFYTVELDIQ